MYSGRLYLKNVTVKYRSINFITGTMTVPVTLKNFEALLLFTTGKKTLYS